MFNPSDIHWFIHSYMIEKNDIHHPNLYESALELGFKATLVPYKSVNDSLPIDENDNSKLIIGYGSHQFILKSIRSYNQILKENKDRHFIAYSKMENLSYSCMSSYFYHDMLNDDYLILPFSEIENRGIRYFDNDMFIRPNAVTKAFSGTVIPKNDFNHEINSIKQLSHVDPECLCAFASAKDIDAEFRFVICDKEVVTGSEYRWDNILDIRSDIHPLSLELAQKVAKAEWQPDSVYVCDIGLINDFKIAKIIELNTFSSAGLYVCDTLKIIEAVSKAAWNEFNMD